MMMSAKDQLKELARAHQAIVGILDSPLLSRPTREQLQSFRDELEKEIAKLNSNMSGDSRAAD